MSVTVPPVGENRVSLHATTTLWDPVVVVGVKVEGVSVTAASLESHTLAHIFHNTMAQKKCVIVLFLFFLHRLVKLSFCLA